MHSISCEISNQERESSGRLGHAKSETLQRVLFFMSTRNTSPR